MRFQAFLLDLPVRTTFITSASSIDLTLGSGTDHLPAFSFRFCLIELESVLALDCPSRSMRYAGMAPSGAALASFCLFNFSSCALMLLERAGATQSQVTTPRRRAGRCAKLAPAVEVDGESNETWVIAWKRGGECSHVFFIWTFSAWRSLLKIFALIPRTFFALAACSCASRASFFRLLL